MNLTAGNAYDDLVGESAGELPTMSRVTPNDVNQSYLWHKINGTQVGLPGLNACGEASNSQMSPSGSLSATDIMDIMTWINTGAEE